MVAVSDCAGLRAGERCLIQRRPFLKGVGVVTIVVVGGGVWRAYDQGVFSVGEGPAYEPWKDWRNHSDEGALALVRAAILAASPHNTQPWLFKVTNSSIELYIDTKRNVGALDPFLREEHIGMGCALENLMLAAAAHGYQAIATLLPGKLGPIPAESKPELLARVDLVSGKHEETDLYDAIPRRHTNRSAYNPQKPIPPQEQFEEIQSVSKQTRFSKARGSTRSKIGPSDCRHPGCPSCFRGLCRDGPSPECSRPNKKRRSSEISRERSCLERCRSSLRSFSTWAVTASLIFESPKSVSFTLTPRRSFGSGLRSSKPAFTNWSLRCVIAPEVSIRLLKSWVGVSS